MIPDHNTQDSDFEITLKSTGVTARVNAVEPEPPVPAPARPAATPTPASAPAPISNGAGNKIVLTAESLSPVNDAATQVMPVAAPAAPSPAKPITQPAQGGIVPPAKRPPTNVSPPKPPDPWHVRYRKALYGVGAAAALLLILATVMIVKSLAEPEANKVAGQASEILEPVNVEIDDAQKVSDFDKASHEATRAANETTKLQARAKQEIGDQKELAAVDALLTAQLGLLRAYSGLAGIDRQKLATTPRRIRDAKLASRKLIAANAGMTAIEREGSVDESATTSATENLEDKLTNAREEMAEWKALATRRKKARARFAADTSALGSIYSTMGAQRNEVERFYNTPWTTGYDGPFVDDFTDDRQALLRQLQGTSVNPLLNDAKSGLADAMDASIDAFPALHTAWVDTSSGDKPRDMPAFYQYDEATEDVDAAVARYNAGIQAAQREAASKYKRPKMPDV